MARIALYKDNYADSTVVSNLFIDEYMKDANDAQLKVYFYLLRMLNADQAISVSGIADKFNHTEKDVIRALKYWEKQQILDLDFDENKALVGIHLRDLSAQATPAPQHNVLLTSGSVQAQNTAGSSMISAAAQRVQTTPQEATPVYTKPAYSLDQLREFKEREETSQLLFIAEAYIGKPLTPSEIKTILFFTDVLHFSDDLIDYLLQYCVERGKKDFKYIEKVAVNWAEEGITTPKQAQKFSTRYDKNVYSIMNTSITRNQMHMHMKHRLTCSLINIDSYVVSVWMISFIYLLLNILEHYIHCFTLMICQIKIRCHMSFRNYQSMARRNRIAIIKRNACSSFTYDFYFT